jgi:hypothetical protein
MDAISGDNQRRIFWKLKSIRWSPTGKVPASIATDETATEWHTSIVLWFYFTDSTATKSGSLHSGEEPMKIYQPRITLPGAKIELASLKDSGLLDFNSTGASLEGIWKTLRRKQPFVDLTNGEPYLVGLERDMRAQLVRGIPRKKSRSSAASKSRPPQRSSRNVGVSILVNLLHVEI